MEQIRQNFERHGFTTQFFSTKEEACCYLSDILQNQTIGFGGSETLMEMGLFEVLQQKNVVSVAMTAFGPQLCYYVIGRNKITANISEAYYRCKNVAAPLNARRVGAKTPCAVKGDKCYDCNSPDRICRIISVIERVPLGMKCEIIFVNEELGF